MKLLYSIRIWMKSYIFLRRQSNFIELSDSNYCKQRVLHYFHFLPLCYITYVRGNLRVFSRTRVHCKVLLNGIGVDSFDPLQIVGKTKGRMAEDNHLNITRKARIVLRSNALIFQTNLWSTPKRCCRRVISSNGWSAEKWYSADHMGYEELCEVWSYGCLRKSNVKDFVCYQPVKIAFDSKEYAGCYSDDFRVRNESIVTLEYLFK